MAQGGKEQVDLKERVYRMKRQQPLHYDRRKIDYASSGCMEVARPRPTSTLLWCRTSVTAIEKNLQQQTVAQIEMVVDHRRQ